MDTPTASSGGPYCQGATVDLFAPIVAGGTYSWTGPAGFTSTLQNPTIANATALNAGTYSVTVTVGGCTSAPGSTTVVVNENPSATITAPTYVTTNTGNTASGPAGMSTYSWSITGGTITSATNTKDITFTAGAPGTLTLSLTVTYSSGCPGSNSVNVTVYAQPAISIGNVIAQAPPKGSTEPFVFHITLSNPSSQVVTVQYYTSNQTAIAGKNYVVAYGTLTFPAGTTEQTETVTVIGTGSTTQKTFLLNLTNPVNATIAIVNGFKVRGTGVIQP